MWSPGMLALPDQGGVLQGKRVYLPDSMSGVQNRQQEDSVHRTLWDRIVEHREALKQQKETSCLHRHWQDCHHSDQGDNPEYEVKVLKTFRSATERQVSEAMSIEGGDFDLLLNLKRN